MGASYRPARPAVGAVVVRARTNKPRTPVVRGYRALSMPHDASAIQTLCYAVPHFKGCPRALRGTPARGKLLPFSCCCLKLQLRVCWLLLPLPSVIILASVAARIVKSFLSSSPCSHGVSTSDG
jgi:hypothetical protein